MNKKNIILGVIVVLSLLLLYQWFKIYHTYERDYGYIRMVQIGVKGDKELHDLYYHQPNAVEHWVLVYWIKETLISLTLIVPILLLFRRLNFYSMANNN
jgi:hypothetical protein